MGRRTCRALLAVSLLLAGAAAGAGEPSPVRKATRADWPIDWYIPPEGGPVAGNQNGWFVTPHDILPGGFTFSGKVENATAEAFEMTPTSTRP